MNNIIESFFIAVLFDDKKTQQTANKTQNVVSDFAKKALTSLAALTSFDVLKGISLNFAENANKLGDIAEKVGENVESVDAYRKAVEMVNGDAEQFTSTLTNIGQKLQKINTNDGRQFAQTLKIFGINAKDANGYLKNATDIIEDYAQKYNKLVGQKRENFVKTLGIDESTEKLLKQGSEGVHKLVKEMYNYGVMTKEQVKLAKEYKRVTKELENTITFLTNKIGSFFLPVLTFASKTIKDFTIFLEQHKNLVIGFFTGLSAVILTKMIPAFARLAVATLTNPFTYIILGVTALIALFAILYEEFEDYKTSGVSDFKAVFDIIIDTKNAITSFIDENSELIQSLKEFGDTAMEVFKFIMRVLLFLGRLLVENFIDNLLKSLEIIKNVGSFINEYILKPILKVLEKFGMLSKIKSVFKMGNEKMGEYIKNGSEKKEGEKSRTERFYDIFNIKHTNPALQTQLKNNGVNQKNTNIKDSNNQVNNITINTNAQDAKNIANEVKQSIPKNNNFNLLQFDSGAVS